MASIRARRREFEKDPAEVLNMLKKGSLKAREITSVTLGAVRAALLLDY